MKRKDIISEISSELLARYMSKAGKGKALAGMGAMFGRSPDERASELSKFKRREKGLDRAKGRVEKRNKQNQEKQLADLVARLPELKAEYERMKAEYKSLGGSNWQYADREQNLTDYERKARSMEGPMNNLWRQIQAAEKASVSRDVSEEQGYDEISPKSASYILRKLDQGVSMSDILDDFPELGRMMDVIAHDHGLHPDDDFEEIENVLMNDLEDIAAEEDDFGDYGSDATDDFMSDVKSDDDEVDEMSGMLKVAKDDDKQTILQNPSTGVQTQIDKTNPNAPRLTQDETGKLKLQAPTGQGSDKEQKPNLIGKDVEVSTAPGGVTESEILRKLAGITK